MGYGFSPEWLAMREAADHRARDKTLLSALAGHLLRCSRAQILDLGCGTGANFRGITDSLPVPQSWRLIDNDHALLDVARMLCRPDASRQLVFEAADLRHDLALLLASPYDLVTAAALFDLVSESWLAEFVKILSARRIPLYAPLIFDGAMSWKPPHPADQDVVAAFARHQHGDKGFGPALGPAAASSLAAKLEHAGYAVQCASSPWLLGPDDQQLIAATTMGVVQAVHEMKYLSVADTEGWKTDRRMCTACSIGHVDLLALPAETLCYPYVLPHE